MSRGHPKVKPRDVFEGLLKGKTLKGIAKELGVTPQAIGKHRDALLKDGAIERIIEREGPSDLYQKGPNSYRFEKSKPLHVQVLEKARSGQDQGRKASTKGNQIDGPTVNEVQNPWTDDEHEEEWFDVYEPHMHGCFLLAVEQLGDINILVIADKGRDAIEVPLFPDEPSMKGHHNCWSWNAKLKIPGRTASIPLELFITTPVGREGVVLLKINPNRTKIRAEQAQLASHPMEYFSEEILDVVRLLEKYADWRFQRSDGHLDWKMCGECWVAHSNPVIDRMVPPNMHGFIDVPDVIFDRSHGKGEAETNRIGTLEAWAKLPQHLEELYGSIDGLKNKQREQEVQMARDRVEINGLFIGNNQLLKENLDLQRRVLEFENIEMKRTHASRLRKSSGEMGRPPIEYCREASPNEVMYQ